MTLAQLQGLTWGLLNDGGGTYYPDATGAINEAQRFFVLLTLCLETTVTLPLVGGAVFQSILANQPGFVLSRRFFNSAGVQLFPATFSDLDAFDTNWRLAEGAPIRYVVRGLDLLAIYPHPAAADTLKMVMVTAPATLANPGDVPQIRAASHYALANYAAFVLRQPEGGQEFSKFKRYFGAFMAEVQKVADIVKARSKDTGYEIMPYELKRQDAL